MGYELLPVSATPPSQRRAPRHLPRIAGRRCRIPSEAGLAPFWLPRCAYAQVFPRSGRAVPARPTFLRISRAAPRTNCAQTPKRSAENTAECTILRIIRKKGFTNTVSCGIFISIIILVTDFEGGASIAHTQKQQKAAGHPRSPRSDDRTNQLNPNNSLYQGGKK